MRIGELARKAGIAASAIRYYESAGLLPRAPRRAGKRVYGEETVTRLKLIALAQAAGFSLRETAQLLQGAEGGKRPAKFNALAERKIAEIDAKRCELARMRALLEAGRACGCVSLSDCEVYAGMQVAVGR